MPRRGTRAEDGHRRNEASSESLRRLRLSPYQRQAIDEWDGPTWSADDKYVAYKLEVGPAKTDQVWIADAQSGKMWHLLSDRGMADDQRWSPTDPRKIVTQIQSSGRGFESASTRSTISSLLFAVGMVATRNSISFPFEVVKECVRPLDVKSEGDF